jgi:hypothetical protein
MEINFKPVKLEKTIEAYLVRRVKQVGGECRKHTGQKAWLDRLCLFDEGRMCFVEVKKKGGKARADQLREVKRLRERGFMAYVVNSKDEIDSMIGEVLNVRIHTSRNEL